MKDALREKFRFFGKQNASHLSVNLPVYGFSGLRRIDVTLSSETHQTGTQPYNIWQNVSNRYLYLFLLVSPPQPRYSTDSE